MNGLPPRQFVKAVNYAITAIDLYRKERNLENGKKE